jgi:hypothetical protein
MSEFYDHGIDMASEIPSSEKSDGFNQYWKAHGSGSKTEARKEYNKGWADYKAGRIESSGGGFWLVAIGGAALAWWFFRKKNTNTGIPT